MSKDIFKILDGWDYDPSNVTVRIVGGNDGRDKVQLRVDLGVLQMELDGRPDGKRPEGHASWLEYYEAQQEAFDAAHPDSASYELGGEDCERLWQEAVQYYHRYLSFWHLKLFDLCIRDTQRNLRLFTFVRAHVADRQHVLQFDQWRPHVILMQTRATAVPLLEKDKYAEAVMVIDSAIEDVESFLDEYEQGHHADKCVELMELKRWRIQVVTTMEEAADKSKQDSQDTTKGSQDVRGAHPLEEELRRKLKEAIDAEEFEKAARLRDEIRRVTGQARAGGTERASGTERADGTE